MTKHTTRPDRGYVSVCVSMTPAQLATLDAFAKSYQMNRSEAVRALIDYRERKRKQKC